MELELKYEIGEVASFLRDLQEEKFPKCEQWDTDPRDCNCPHCRIEHFALRLAIIEPSVENIVVANEKLQRDLGYHKQILAVRSRSA